MTNQTPRRRNKGILEAALALRAENCARILAVLEKGPMATAQISDALGLRQSACYSCLRYLSGRLHQIHAVGQRDSLGRNYWQLGRAAAQPVQPAKKAAAFGPPEHRRIIVPARQMGIVRDGLLAAFFGPAGEQRP